MTEKRFISNYDGSEIIDRKGSIDYAFRSGAERPVIELLNRLNDENEQLKKDATTLIYVNQDYRKENEQLKQENNELILLVKKMGELGGFNKHLLKTMNESFEERLRNNPMPTKSDNDE